MPFEMFLGFLVVVQGLGLGIGVGKQFKFGLRNLRDKPQAVDPGLAAGVWGLVPVDVA